MRRAVGVTLIIVGLLPLTAAIAVALWVWAQHMHTVGFSADGRAISVLILIVLADVCMVGGGIYLVSGPRSSS